MAGTPARSRRICELPTRPGRACRVLELPAQPRKAVRRSLAATRPLKGALRQAWVLNFFGPGPETPEAPGRSPQGPQWASRASDRGPPGGLRDLAQTKLRTTRNQKVLIRRSRPGPGCRIRTAEAGALPECKGDSNIERGPAQTMPQPWICGKPIGLGP